MHGRGFRLGRRAGNSRRRGVKRHLIRPDARPYPGLRCRRGRISTQGKAEQKNVKSQAQRGEADLSDTGKQSALRSQPAGQADAHRSGNPGFQLEHFQDAIIAAEYLHCSRKHVLRLSRLGLIPAHPISFGRRVTWRYLLSELHAWVLSNRAPVNLAGNGASGRRMVGGSPRTGGR